MIFKKLKNEQIMTLIGAIMIKLATGIIGSWGNVNLYYFSYFREQGQTITTSTNSSILLVVVLPLSIFVLAATKLSNRFGYEFIIRICAACFAISPLIINFKFNITTTTIFYIMIPGLAFGISAVPLLNCLWTQFPNIKNQVTAILVIFFGIGTLLWNFLLMYLVNPNNVQANIQQNGIKFFQSSVTSRLKQSCLFLNLLTGSLFIGGSLMIKKAQINQEKGPIKSQVTNPQSTQTLQITTRSTLTESLFERRFIFIFFISIMMNVYQIYVLQSLKIVYMPIINDDHFLSYCLLAHTIASILGAFLWGYIGDKKGFPKAMLIIAGLDMLFKIYGIIATGKITLMILFILIGFTDKGMVTIVGPGLVDIFGLEIGTQLLPFKGSSIMFAFILVPLVQLMTSFFLTPHQLLIFLASFSILAFLMSFKFISTNKNFPLAESSDEELKVQNEEVKQCK